jgi:hypothetical protein
MDSTVRDLVRLRSAALWCAITAAVAGLVLVSLPTLAASPRLIGSDPAFTDLLVTACAAVSLVAGGWLWAITTDVVVGVLKAGGRVAVRRRGPIRILLLAACGAVALSTTVAPASADESRPVAPSSLAGLPLPDRATSEGRLPRPEHIAPSTVVRVRSGDSLWAISEARLGSRATIADLVDYWHRIYDHNADVIGPDPDLIFPGQLLELPPIG